MTTVTTSSDSLTKAVSNHSDNALSSFAADVGMATGGGFANLLARIDTSVPVLGPQTSATSSQTKSYTDQSPSGSGNPGRNNSGSVENTSSGAKPVRMDASTGSLSYSSAPSAALGKKSSSDDMNAAKPAKVQNNTSSNTPASAPSSQANSTTPSSGDQTTKKADVSTVPDNTADTSSNDNTATSVSDATTNAAAAIQVLSTMTSFLQHLDKRTVTSGDSSLTSGATTSASPEAGSTPAVDQHASTSGATNGSDALKAALSGDQNTNTAGTANDNASGAGSDLLNGAATPGDMTQSVSGSLPKTANMSAGLTNPATTSLAGDGAATQTNFVDLLKNATGSSSAPTGFSPLKTDDQIAPTSGQNGASLDLDKGQQGDNLSALARTTSSQAKASDATSTGAARSVNPYSFASQLSAMRASGTSLLNPIDQVVLQLNRNAKSGNDQMTLQLHPADLGQVNIKLDISSDGKVSGTVTASNPATLDMLSKDSRSLERSLQDAGFQADPGSLQFGLGNQSGNHTGQSAQNAPSGFSTNSTSNSVEGVVDASVNPVQETYYITPTGVNLSV